MTETYDKYLVRYRKTETDCTLKEAFPAHKEKEAVQFRNKLQVKGYSFVELSAVKVFHKDYRKSLQEVLDQVIVQDHHDSYPLIEGDKMDQFAHYISNCFKQALGKEGVLH